ncbi:MAG: hypothetical protein ACYS9T_07510 [Planctomycetota bacterium]|jgi:hypothetical protein
MDGFGGGDTRGLHCSYCCCQKTVERSPEGYLRRVFPWWLVLAVLLAFMTVSYMEFRTYEQVVADRDYLIDKTQEQLYRMSVWLAVALTIYAVVLMLFCCGQEQLCTATITTGCRINSLCQRASLTDEDTGKIAPDTRTGSANGDFCNRPRLHCKRVS